MADTKQQAPDLPVYLFTGFLEAGKTKFIQETLEDSRFHKGERTLLLLCEEGEEVYEPDKFCAGNVFVRNIDEESDLTVEHLKALQYEIRPERVLVEFNGMWMLDSLYGNLPEGWAVAQEFLFCDATSFLSYNANMRQLMVDKLKSAELVVLNRYNDSMDRMEMHRIIRAISRRCDIAYEYTDGKVVYDDIEDPLPFDLDAPVVEIEDRDFAIWYRDMSEEPKKYDGKTIEVKCRCLVRKNVPKGCFIAGRHIMTCCVQDIQFAGIICVWDRADEIRNDEWAIITARLDYKFHRGARAPCSRCSPCRRSKSRRNRWPRSIKFTGTKNQPPCGRLIFLCRGSVFRILGRGQQDAVVIKRGARLGGEGIEQALHGHARALRAGDIEHDAAGIHHERARAEFERLVHIVRDHEAGDAALGHDAAREREHLVGRDGVERGRVLVEQQQLGRDHGGHEQRQRLTLAAGEQADGRVHAVLQPHVELGERIAEKVAVLTGHAAEEHVPVRRAQVGHGEVLLDGHVRRGALERVLEQVANAAAALIRRQERDVPPVKRDGAGIHIKHAGNGIEERALAGAVGADDGGKLPVGQPEREVGNGALLVHGAGVERLGNVRNFKHRSRPPFRTGRAACGHWT